MEGESHPRAGKGLGNKRSHSEGFSFSPPPQQQDSRENLRDHHIHLTKSHAAMRWHQCRQFQEAPESGRPDECCACGVEGGERFEPKCFLLLTVEHWEFTEIL